MQAKISEIFYSLQMEGSYIGYPAAFIRFSGCNLDCDFCDTKYALKNGTIMNEREIFENIEQYNTKRIIFTGGEPALHDLFMADFAYKHDKLDYFLETNGTIFIKESIKIFEHVVVSPKFFAINEEVLVLFKQNAKSVEFKFIVDESDDIEKVEYIADRLNLYPVTLQPLFDNYRPIQQYVDKTKVIIEAFKKSSLSLKNVRLIMQNHKVIYKEKRGV
jgi:7-carboxy-7-deazaguanine synthase